MNKSIAPHEESEQLRVGTYFYTDTTLYKIREVTPETEERNSRFICATISLGRGTDLGIEDFNANSFELNKRSSYRTYRLVPNDLIGGTMEETRKQIHEEYIKSISDLTNYFGEDEKEETALVPTNTSVDQIERAQEAIEEVKNRALILKAMAEATAKSIGLMIDKQNNRINYLMRVLGLLNAYIGVDKEFIIIQDGVPAPKKTKINIRQLILYADEEVGDLTRYEATEIIGGAEYTTYWSGLSAEEMPKFDAWLLENDNYLQIVPEERCVTGIRPRRYVYDRHAENDYILHLIIRNGKQLYRVTMPDIYSGDMLFPPGDEWDEIISEVQKAEKEGREEDIMNARSKQIKVMKKIAFLQGLINNGEILLPLPGAINLFDPDTYQESVNIIRDAENIIGDGHETYKQWKEELNANIKMGSRILIPDIAWGRFLDGNNDTSRFDDRFVNKTPPYPDPGVYTIEKYFPKRQSYRMFPEYWGFLYRPTQEEYISTGGWWQDERRLRKSRITFKVWASDDFVFAYDHVELKDIEYFMGDRLARQNYATMLPILHGLIAELRKEHEAEKNFVTLVANDLDVGEGVVQDAISWWKHKVKLFRPIREDEDKAWRMIRKEIRMNRVRAIEKNKRL